MGYSPRQLAEAFIETGELSDALAALAEHLTNHPADETARRWQIAVRLRMSDPAELRAALEDLAWLSDWTTDDHMRRVGLLDALGDSAAALAASHEMAQTFPDNERLNEVYLERLVMNGDYAEARALLSRMPQTWRWLQWAGDVAIREGDDARAADCYSHALADLERAFAAPDTGFAAALKATLLVKRGHANCRLGQYPAAAADYQAAERLIPDDMLLRFNRGLVAALQGQPETATELCHGAYQQANDELRARMRDDVQADARFAILAAIFSET